MLKRFNFLQMFKFKRLWSMFLVLVLCVGGVNVAVAEQVVQPNPVVEQEEVVDKAKIKADIVEQFRNVVAQQKSDSTGDTSYNDQVIVKFVANTTPQQIDSFVQENSLKTVDEVDEHRFGVFQVDNFAVTVELLEQLNAVSIVEYAEPNYIFSLPETEVSETLNPSRTDASTSEPYFFEQWGLKNNEHPGKDINVLPAWDITKGDNTVVAVLDTGVRGLNRDLKDRMVPGWNIYEDNNNTVDTLGHGTKVASVIAASENGQDIIGVAPKTKIMPLKISADGINVETSNIMKAVDYAVNKKVDVINISVGGDRNFSSAFKESLERANKTGIVVVAAAGNSAKNNDDTPLYPASYSKDVPNVISVTGIKEDGSFHVSLNYGFHSVNMAAPGRNILTTFEDGKLEFTVGTSFAAPFVSGVVALMKSVNHSYTPQQIRDVLEQTVTKDGSLTNKTVSGGFVNAGRAVQAAKDYEFGGKKISLRSGVNRAAAVDITSDNNAAIWEGHEGTNQTFTAIHDDKNKGWYRLQAANNQQYLAWDYGSKNSNNVVVKGFEDSGFQRWRFDLQSDGSFVITSAGNTNVALTLAKNSSANGINVHVSTKPASLNAQYKWQLAPIGGVVPDDYMYRIVPKLDEQSVVEGYKTKGSKKINGVQLWDKNDGQHQKWVSSYDAKTASYRFRTYADTDKLMLTWNTGAKADNEVTVFESNGRNDQYWVVEPTVDGFFTLASLRNQVWVLDLSAGETSNGTKIFAYPRSGADKQKWKLLY